MRRPLVFDSYTGADLAWAYNTPLLRLGGAGLGLGLGLGLGFGLGFRLGLGYVIHAATPCHHPGDSWFVLVSTGRVFRLAPVFAPDPDPDPDPHPDSDH